MRRICCLGSPGSLLWGKSDLQKYLMLSRRQSVVQLGSFSWIQQFCSGTSRARYFTGLFMEIVLTTLLYSIKHAGVPVFSGDSKWQIPLSLIMVSCTEGFFCQKERQCSLARALIASSPVLPSCQSTESKRGKMGQCPPAVHAASWASETTMGSWSSDSTLSTWTRLPHHWNSWGQLCLCREEPGMRAICVCLTIQCAWLSSVCKPGNLAWNYSLKQQWVFSAECHSQSWLLQEPECGWQNTHPVQHIAQML